MNIQNNVAGIITMDIRDEYCAEVIARIENGMHEAGFGTLICSLGGEQARLASCAAMLAKKQAAGVFLVGKDFSNEDCRRAIEETIPALPVVIAGGYLRGKLVYSVFADEKQGIVQAVDRMAKQGRTRIALLFDSDSPNDWKKREGYEKAVMRHSLMPIEFSASHSAESGRRETRRLLQAYPDIDAIQYTDDVMAAGGIHALLDLGIQVPEQIAVSGFGNSKVCMCSAPYLTSVDRCAEEIGALAAETMLQVMKEQAASAAPDKVFTETISAEMVSTETTATSVPEKESGAAGREITKKLNCISCKIIARESTDAAADVQG